MCFDAIVKKSEARMIKPDIPSNQLSLAIADPVSAMAEFEQLLVSNSGEDAFDCAIRLLAAKLVDELEQIAEPSFRIYPSAEETHRVIASLYKLAIERWPEINGTGAELELTPSQLVRSIRPLVGWNLIGSDLSLLDATLERLVSKSTKGALGQYFTPRDAIRFCVEVL
jgi:hypothetical protein